jgi:hypothetical protein
MSTDDDDGPDLPSKPLMEAARVYRAKFGRMPPIMGIPSARYPELIAELQAGPPLAERAVQRAARPAPNQVPLTRTHARWPRPSIESDNLTLSPYGF